jgi:hypothetical protein
MHVQYGFLYLILARAKINSVYKQKHAPEDSIYMQQRSLNSLDELNTPEVFSNAPD